MSRCYPVPPKIKGLSSLQSHTCSSRATAQPQAGQGRHKLDRAVCVLLLTVTGGPAECQAAPGSKPGLPHAPAEVPVDERGMCAAAFRAPAEGQAVQAYAPSYPGVREERWWFMLANVPQNAVMALNPTSLLRAEAAGVALQIRPGTPAALEASGAYPTLAHIHLTCTCMSTCTKTCACTCTRTRAPPLKTQRLGPSGLPPCLAGVSHLAGAAGAASFPCVFPGVSHTEKQRPCPAASPAVAGPMQVQPRHICCPGAPGLPSV